MGNKIGKTELDQDIHQCERLAGKNRISNAAEMDYAEDRLQDCVAAAVQKRKDKKRPPPSDNNLVLPENVDVTVVATATGKKKKHHPAASLGHARSLVRQ